MTPSKPLARSSARPDSHSRDRVLWLARPQTAGSSDAKVCGAVKVRLEAGACKDRHPSPSRRSLVAVCSWFNSSRQAQQVRSRVVGGTGESSTETGAREGRPRRQHACRRWYGSLSEGALPTRNVMSLSKTNPPPRSQTSHPSVCERKPPGDPRAVSRALTRGTLALPGVQDRLRCILPPQACHLVE